MATMTSTHSANEYQYLMEKVLLSDVILDNLFQYLSFEQLLATRLVNKKWRRESDRAIKKRDNFLFLSTEKDFMKITEKISDFKRSRNHIIFNKLAVVFEKINLENPFVQRFFLWHGACLTKLKVRFAFETPPTENSKQSFRKLLEKRLPNLRSLQVFGFPEHLWGARDLFDENKFNGRNCRLLPKLEALGFFMVDGYPKYFSCPLYLNILNCVGPVVKFAVNYDVYLSIFFEEAISSKQNRIRTFFYGVKDFSTIYGSVKSQLTQRRPEMCQPITTKNCLYNLARLCPNISKLRLCLSRQVPKHAFEYLMATLGGNLVELELSDHWRRVYENPVIFPAENRNETRLSEIIFKKLKILKLKDQIFLPAVTFGSLAVKNFPALEYLKIRYSPTMFYNTRWIGENRHPLKSLVLDGLPIKCKDEDPYETFEFKMYSDAFPSLKSLKINVANNFVLRDVYANFPNLEELEIIGGYTDEGLCGIPQFVCDFYHPNVEEQTSPHPRMKELRQFSYIGGMKNLKKLKVVSNISTFSALYGLADLSNLTSLYIEFCWINDLPIRMLLLLPALKKLKNLKQLEISEAYIQPCEALAMRKIANLRFIPDRTRYLV